MTKKHFNELAAELSDVKPDQDEDAAYRQWARCVNAVMRVCGRSNPYFDVDRFLQACGYTND